MTPFVLFLVALGGLTFPRITLTLVLGFVLGFWYAVGFVVGMIAWLFLLALLADITNKTA